MSKPTVVVLGAYGSAGSDVAARLAEEDVELVLVDDGDPGGGLCILEGCMPSKEVLSAADHRYRVRSDHRVQGTPEVDLAEVVETKDDHTLGWAEHRREAVHDLAERGDVEFVHGTAEFVDESTVEVDGRRLDADYVVVATGSTLNVPSLPGVEDVDWMSSSDVLDARSFGDSGVVMGFGTVGVELVPYLSECGVDVTVVEHDSHPLDDAGDEFGQRLLEIYRDEFDVEVVTHAYEQRVESTDDDGVRLYLDVEGEGERVVEADDLYLFTGRRPNLPDGLDSLTSPEPGWVDDTLQARDLDGVFVVGDANGRRPILHVAKEEAEVAADNVVADIHGEPFREHGSITHKVVFSGLAVYPYAVVGLTEERAREKGFDPVVVSRDASSDGVFKTKDAARGLAKLVVSGDGEVLGWEGMHLHADVMAKTLQVVVENNLDVHKVPDRAYHPTTPELLDGLLREAKQQL